MGRLLLDDTDGFRREGSGRRRMLGQKENEFVGCRHPIGWWDWPGLHYLAPGGGPQEETASGRPLLVLNGTCYSVYPLQKCKDIFFYFF